MNLNSFKSEHFKTAFRIDWFAWDPDLFLILRNITAY